MNLADIAKQFARFGSVGVLNTALDYVLFWCCVYVLGMSVVPSNVVSVSVATANSFIMNRAWTFRTDGPRENVVAHVFRFALVALLMFALSTSSVALLGEALPAWLAKAVSIPPVMLVNFVLLRRYVFVR